MDSCIKLIFEDLPDVRGINRHCHYDGPESGQIIDWFKKRQYIAEVTVKFLDGNARKAERIFGWGRKAVEKGIQESKTGIPCIDNYSARGCKKTEDREPQLRVDIRALVEPQSQTDPDFKAPFRYTRITAESVRKALVEYKGWSVETLPSIRTIQNILNRMGYCLRRVQKS